MADEFGQRSPKTSGYLNSIEVYDDDSPAVMDPIQSYAAAVPTVVSSSNAAETPDAQNAFGLPGGYNNQALRLAHEETVSDQNAMSYLRQALNNSSEVTPSQGFAAALLAAIPTLGGYMIGQSVGDPEIPEGITGFDRTKYQTGGAAGGMMGAQAGLAASNSFLTGIQQEGEKKRGIYEKMAALESKRADKLDTQENQIITSGLNAQARRDEILDPELRQAKLDQVRAEAQARAEARPSYGGGGGAPVALPPEMLQSLGLDPSIPHSSKEISIAVQLKKEGGINSRFGEKNNQQEESTVIPGAVKLPGVRPTNADTSKTREMVANYNQMAEVHLPELKRVFTDPNVTVDEQNAALSGAIVAIKNQQKMGANFTGLEEQLVRAGLPRIAQIDTGSLINFFKADLQGQDPIAKINRLEQIVDQSVDAQIRPYGFAIDRAPTQDTQNGGGTKAQALARIQELLAKAGKK